MCAFGLFGVSVLCLGVCVCVCPPSLHLLILRPPHIVNGLLPLPLSPPPLSSNIHDEDDGGQPAVAMALTAALTFTHLTALNHRKLNVIAI